MVRIGARAVALGAVVVLVVSACAVVASAAGVALPDGRGYELVSPAAKNGLDVIPQTDKHHVAPDGNAVTFSSLGGFGVTEGSSFDFEYLSQRTGLPGTSGWSTHGINPPERPVTYSAAVAGSSSTFVDAFAPDLSAAIYKTWRPLVDAPNVVDVSNLYRITGLNGGARTAQIMSDAVAPVPPAWATFFNGLFVKQIVPVFDGASSDLRHVVFESPLDLTADAPPYPDVPDGSFCAFAGLGCPAKLYENADGTVRLVGRVPQAPNSTCDDVVGPACVAADSSQAALSSTFAFRFYSRLTVSADGRRIYFQVPAGVESGAVYVREDGVRAEQLTANGRFWTAASDGSRAFFTTVDSLLPADTDSVPDLYMYDANAPAGSRLTLVSAASSGIDGYVDGVLGSSADGHTVYFVCDGQLIAGGPPVTIMGLYVWHDGQLRYIGHFDSLGEVLPNSPRTAWAAPSAARASRITADGRHLLFTTISDAGFVGRGGFGGYDHAGHRELYLYDADTGRLVCASCNPSGRPATTAAVIAERDASATSDSTSDSAQALTDDGRRVFFNTAEALVSEDMNGRPDAYEYDVPSATVHLLSSGRSTAPSYFVDATASGDDVFIVTRDRLVGWDVDNSYDLYDARVGGGFPEPPVLVPNCSGEACLPSAVAPPAASAVGTSTHRGPGDSTAKLKKHRACARRKVLRTVHGKRKCVRRRSHRHAKRAEIRDERSGR